MIKYADTINTNEYIQCCDGEGITYVKDLLVENEYMHLSLTVINLNLFYLSCRIGV